MVCYLLAKGMMGDEVSLGRDCVGVWLFVLEGVGVDAGCWCFQSVATEV